jgi:DNA-binding GntR family transcriptional regulator
MVAALIRELIITGELTTGEQLRQRDLAQRFGVSQTPVRYLDEKPFEGQQADA